MKHQNNNNKIKTNMMPLADRPDEKFLKYGPDALTDAELLAVIIRTGNRDENSIELSKRILLCPDNSSSILNIINLPLNELMKIPGIGKVKAIQIKCIAELSRRISRSYFGQGTKFNSPKIIADFYMEDMRFLKYEAVKVLMLDTKNNFICDRTVSKGTINASIISAREIFVEALSHNAVYIVLLHNHPSGDPRPSREDLAVTEKIKESGEIIGIKLLDHIIIGDKKYVSLKEQGII